MGLPRSFHVKAMPRKDIVELQLGMTDDFMQTSLVILGSLDPQTEWFRVLTCTRHNTGEVEGRG